MWADNTNFNQILIAPFMIQDHMPYQILGALEKLLVHTGPAKPHTNVTNNKNQIPKEPVVTNMVDNSSSAAPLAPPETISDISSVSSRSTGIRLSWAALPVFTVNNDKHFSEQKVVTLQPSAHIESRKSEPNEEVVTLLSDELNIPLVENDIYMNSNINTINISNK